MRLLSAIPSPVLTITTTGFVATVAQIIIVRELLVLFYGNELSAGLIFACWLLWTGLGSGLSAKWALKVSTHTTLLRLMLLCLSAMLPLSVLFIRATRIIWMLPAGELPSIGKMLLISVTVTGLFCPVSGALFGICWAIHRRKKENRPLGIYLGEALGSAAGGLTFYFIFIPYVSVSTTLWITCGMILFSGESGDGLKGAMALRQSGARVWVQTPESTSFPGLPRAAGKLGLAANTGTPAELAADFAGLYAHARAKAPVTELAHPA